jgi:hypothetical protein
MPTRRVTPLAHVTETPTQRALVQWLRHVLPPGSKVAAVVNETGAAKSSDPIKRARYFSARIAAGVLPGWPDLLCALPGGRVVWIETKRPVGGVLSVDQQDIHRDLRAIGHHVGVACDPESALLLLREAGVDVRAGDMVPRPAVVRLASRAPRRTKAEKANAMIAASLRRHTL